MGRPNFERLGKKKRGYAASDRPLVGHIPTIALTPVVDGRTGAYEPNQEQTWAMVKRVYDLITNKLDDGLNYQQVADWLNENDYLTPRGKRFRNAHAHSIVKKKRVRDERFGREYQPVYSNFQVRFVEKKLIKQ